MAFDTDVLGKVAEASFLLKDTGLFKVVSELIDKNPPKSFFKSAGKALHSMDHVEMMQG